jgi:hypothetical protein
MLTLHFLLLAVLRAAASTLDAWAGLFPCLFTFFLFYILNYGVLVDRRPPEAPQL